MAATYLCFKVTLKHMNDIIDSLDFQAVKSLCLSFDERFSNKVISEAETYCRTRKDMDTNKLKKGLKKQMTPEMLCNYIREFEFLAEAFTNFVILQTDKKKF